jgi:hypothetical protein
VVGYDILSANRWCIARRRLLSFQSTPGFFSATRPITAPSRSQSYTAAIHTSAFFTKQRGIYSYLYLAITPKLLLAQVALLCTPTHDFTGAGQRPFHHG